MRPTTRILGIAALALLWSAGAFAARFSVNDTFTQEYAIDADGSVWIDNPFGNIEVIGTDEKKVSVAVVKTTNGVDQDAIKEGRQATQLLVTGDNRMRAFRTAVPLLRSQRWSSSVSYTVKVPRTVQVRIASNSSERIRIASIGGSVTVKNFNGAVTLENVTGQAAVDTVNGTIIYDPQGRPAASVQLSTVNGSIHVATPADAQFRLVAETLRGDLLTTLPISGRYNGATFRGHVNAARGPIITAISMMGNIFFLKRGSAPQQARSVRSLPEIIAQQPSQQMMSAPVVREKFQRPFIEGHFVYATTLGDISIGQVRGNARVETGAGEVHFGQVLGDANIISLGGPLNLGDLFGPVVAETKGGDITVQAARAGGTLITGGGMIRVLYTGAATTLRSGGGDIFIRQAGGNVNADTRSGDISINTEPALRSAVVNARTAQGNVILNVGSRFGADVEAIVMTSEPEHNSIRSDIPGLTISREQVGGRTRIRATGKLNGGGERVELYADEGDIRITVQGANPLVTP